MAKKKNRRKRKKETKKNSANSNEKKRLKVEISDKSEEKDDSQRMVSGTLGVIKTNAAEEPQAGLSGSIVGLASGEISLNPSDPLRVAFDSPDKSIVVESTDAIEETPFAYQPQPQKTKGNKSTLRMKLTGKDREEMEVTPIPGRKRKKKISERLSVQRVPSKENTKVEAAKFVPGSHNLPFIDLKKQPQAEKKSVTEVGKSKTKSKSKSKVKSPEVKLPFKNLKDETPETETKLEKSKLETSESEEPASVSSASSEKKTKTTLEYGQVPPPPDEVKAQPEVDSVPDSPSEDNEDTEKFEKNSLSLDELSELKEGMDKNELSQLKSELNPLEKERLDKLLEEEKSKKLKRQKFKDSIKNIPSPFALVEDKNKKEEVVSRWKDGKSKVKAVKQQKTTKQKSSDETPDEKRGAVVSSGSFELKTIEDDHENGIKSTEPEPKAVAPDDESELGKAVPSIKISDEVKTQPLEAEKTQDSSQNEQLPPPPPEAKTDSSPSQKKATPVQAQVKELEVVPSKSEETESDKKNVVSDEERIPDKGFSDIEEEFFETEIAPENDFTGLEDIFTQIEEEHGNKSGLLGSIKNMLVKDTTRPLSKKRNPKRRSKMLQKARRKSGSKTKKIKKTNKTNKNNKKK